MKAFKFFIVFILLIASTLFAFKRSVHTNSKFPLNVPHSLLHSGDIIFRDGRGPISGIFRNMSRSDQSYSHAGFVHLEDSVAYVYHIIGGEGKNSFMRKDKLSDFCDRNEAYSIGVYRSSLNAAEIDSLAGKLFSQHIRFDDKFDLSTNDKMYCTELVYKVLCTISHDDNFIPLTTVRNITYCSCDNIFLSPHMKKIYSYRYQ